MTVQEAKDAARDWVLRNRGSIPNFAGALYAGSVVYKHDHEPFPTTSDVELAVIIDGPVPNSMVDPAAPLAQRRILHRDVRVHRSRLYPDIDLQAFCRPLFVGGATDLVRSGFHRESACYFATRRSWYQNAIENDGTEQDRQVSRKGYERLLAALGISGVSDVRAKGEALRALLPDLLRLAETVMAANPRIDRS